MSICQNLFKFTAAKKQKNDEKTITPAPQTKAPTIQGHLSLAL